MKLKSKGRPVLHKGKKLYPVERNPYRDGGRRHKNFSLIRKGMRYEDYVRKGGNTQDLNLMINTGSVEVRDK